MVRLDFSAVKGKERPPEPWKRRSRGKKEGRPSVYASGQKKKGRTTAAWSEKKKVLT